jgi:hypothetical protein
MLFGFVAADRASSRFEFFSLWIRLFRHAQPSLFP